MATSQGVKLISAEAGSSVTVYRLVTQAADGQMDHVADATEVPIGVAAETVTTVGQSLPVAIPNGAIVKMEAGAAITINAALEAAGDGTGRCITHTTGAGDYKVGTAMTAAGAAGDIIEVQFLVDLDQA